ncbi:MAG: hypothetical protein GXN93_03280 [Candidatus Diapherotrites archaeon]|nr:hypothetical protein [Candidatus Diapherotrites archaeon]
MNYMPKLFYILNPISEVIVTSILEVMMMSHFLRWWDRYKRRVMRNTNAKLPDDSYAFLLYLESQPLNLQSKQEIVRFYVKDKLGQPIKETRRNMKKLRRARRFYQEFASKQQELYVVQFVAAV